MPNTPPKPGAAEVKGSDRVPARRGWRARLAGDRTSRRWALGLVVAGFALGLLCYPPFSVYPLAPVAALVAFLAVRLARTPGEALRRMLWFGTFFYYCALHWLTAVTAYAPIPFLAALAIPLLGLYIALWPGLLLYGARRWCWPIGPGGQFLVFTAAWLLAEWLRTLGSLAVPLVQLGHAWASWPLAIQPAQFLGELGVSLEILWVAGVIFYWGQFAWERRGGRRPAPSPASPAVGRGLMATLFLPVVPLASLLLLVFWPVRIANFQKKPEAESLSVALVQPGITQPIKLASYAAPYRDVQQTLTRAIVTLEQAMAEGRPRPDWDALMRRVANYPEPGQVTAGYTEAFRELQAEVDALRQELNAEHRMRNAESEAPVSRQASTSMTSMLPISSIPSTAPLDLTVLPETSFTDFDFAVNPESQAVVGSIVRRTGAPLLVGAGHATDPELTQVFNSAYLVEPDGKLAAEVYDKIRLVPFGESLPYFDLVPGFQQFVVGIGSFTPGTRPVTFGVRGLKADGTPGAPIRLGMMICFESTFSSSARAAVRAGADVLAVITNDGWFGRSAGPEMHFELARLRAVETRRYVVQCANTGVTAAVDPTGRLLGEPLAVGESGVLRARITPKLDYGQTMFVRFGNTWLLAAALTLVIGFVSNRRRRAGRA